MYENCRRKSENKCPECGHELLAREETFSGDIVICMSPSCSWACQSQREMDYKLKTVAELKAEWA